MLLPRWLATNFAVTAQKDEADAERARITAEKAAAKAAYVALLQRIEAGDLQTSGLTSSCGGGGGGGAAAGVVVETILDVKYDAKDEVKALGARWDSAQKKWFVPPGISLAPFSKWLPHSLGSIPPPPPPPSPERFNRGNDVGESVEPRGATDECYACGEVGHWATSCPGRANQNPLKLTDDHSPCEDQKCFSCGEGGHWARDCPTKTPRRPSDIDKCYVCNEAGHWGTNCPKKGHLPPRSHGSIPSPETCDQVSEATSIDTGGEESSR